MAKKSKPEPDFSNFSWRTSPSIQIVAIRYADGREVTLSKGDDVGDRAMLEELRDYIKLRDLGQVFGAGMLAQDLRDLANDISEAEREHYEAERKKVSERNRRTDLRKARDVTREELERFRDEFYAREAKMRGWMKAACRKYNISHDTLRARLDA